MRKKDDINKFPRTDKINHEYYARNNEPSFSQFGKDYHFYDDEERQYMIANENKDVFQNKRLRYTPDSKRCISNNYNEITLYVKLPSGTKWFSENDTGRSHTIYTRIGNESFPIVLKGTMKGQEKRRTGTITVSGLGRSVCDRLLNQ